MKVFKGLLTVACILVSAQFLEAQWTTGTSLIYYNGGNVGIGTITPQAKLDIYNGNFRLSGPSNDGVEVSTLNANGYNYYSINAKTSGNGVASGYVPGGNGLAMPYALQFVTDASSPRSNLLIAGMNAKHMISVDGTGSEQWDLVFRNAAPGVLWANAPDIFTIKPGAPGNSLFINGNGNIGLGTSSPGTSALAIERSNNDGGLTNAPMMSIKNTSTTLPAGSGFNIAGANYFAGNGAVLGQCVANYGVGGGSPWAGGSGFYITTRTDHPIIFATGAATTEQMRIGVNGNVGIGTDKISSSSYKLYVEGNIRARKVRVDQDTWADYVFNTCYHLRPLSEVEQYIQQYHHLPEVPSTAEVEKNGLDVGDNQATLLKKIEELTLYVIEQNKKLQDLEKQVKELKEDNQKLASH